MAPFPSFGGALITSLAWLIMPLGIVGYALVSKPFRNGCASLFTRTSTYFTGPPQQPLVQKQACEKSADPAGIPADDVDDADLAAWNSVS